jgi:hypothetical protein
VPPERAAEQSRQFLQRMTELSDGLEGRTPPPPVDLSDLVHRIEHASDESARQALIREYLDGALRLPPEQQATALHQMSAFASPTATSTSIKGVSQ